MSRRHSGLEQLVLASANPKKVVELRQLLEGFSEVIPRPSDAPETIEDQDSLEGNAKKKAREIATLTLLPALADDTGLFVSHLDGKPGVFTARYAGPNATAEANNAKLLTALANANDRTAIFRTVIAVVWPDGRELLSEGSVHGVITHEAQGPPSFGYDPIFAPIEGFDGARPVTFAEMTSAEKHAVSHRGRAFAALKDALLLDRPS